jgi:hypothetical protein
MVSKEEDSRVNNKTISHLQANNTRFFFVADIAAALSSSLQISFFHAHFQCLYKEVFLFKIAYRNKSPT